jgi:hypothetical protein
VIFIAFEDDGSLLVYGDALAVCYAYLTQPCVANPIVVIDLSTFSAAHASELMLFLIEPLKISHVIHLQFVLVAAGAISIDVNQFAADAVSLSAVRTSLRALLMLPA